MRLLHCNVLEPVVALSWLAASAAVGVLVVFVLLIVIIAPWGSRSGDALDHETQARLLLNEDPDEIDRRLRERSGDAILAEPSPTFDRSEPLPFDQFDETVEGDDEP